MARDRRRASAPPPSPEELAAALDQFNHGVQETREIERHRKAVDKADRRRKDAAARMKQVLGSDAGAEERAAAESDYRDAVAAWQQLNNPGQGGDTVDGEAPVDADGADDEPSTDEPAEGAGEEPASL
jgi:hypothetical protein